MCDRRGEEKNQLADNSSHVFVGSRRDFAQCIYIDSSHGKYFVSYLGNKRRADTKKCLDQRTRNDGIWLQGEKAEAALDAAAHRGCTVYIH